MPGKVQYCLKFKNIGGTQMNNVDFVAIAAFIASAAAFSAVGVNIWMVKKAAKEHRFQYLQDRKVTAYSEIMAAFEEVCEANTADDNERKRIAETVMNSAIAMIDLIAPKHVYHSVTAASTHVDSPRTDKTRNIELDRMYTEFRKDLAVGGHYEQATLPE
jgi:hypothetical protein